MDNNAAAAYYALEITEMQLYLSSLTVLIYASLLQLPDEIEYIWKRKFSLPTFLYLFAKYPVLLSASLVIVQVSLSASVNLCNDLSILTGVISAFPLIGVQGLISVRTYSLCQGYRPITTALLLTFLTALVLEIYALSIPSCGLSSPTTILIALSLVQNLAIILSDILAFIVVVYQAWGLWKLKRGLKLQNNESSGSVVTTLLRQGILRFCFVLLVTTVGSLFPIIGQADAGDYLTPFQNVLSVLLLCEFTLDLRRRNSTIVVPNQSALTLPALSSQNNSSRSMRSRLEQLHERIVAEMGESNDLIHVYEPCSREPDTLQDDSHGINLERNEQQREVEV